MTKDSCNGRLSDAAVLCAGWRVVSAEREAWHRRRGQLVGGRILAGDTSYKFTKVKMKGTRSRKPEGIDQKHRNLKHWMVEF